MAELPFMATENIMMDAVKAGGDRQELHEKIRVASMEAGRIIKEEGGNNELPSLIAKEPAFGIDEEQIKAILKPELYTGRASIQVDNYLKNFVKPVLEKNADALGVISEINV